MDVARRKISLGVGTSHLDDDDDDGGGGGGVARLRVGRPRLDDDGSGGGGGDSLASSVVRAMTNYVVLARRRIQTASRRGELMSCSYAAPATSAFFLALRVKQSLSDR